MACISDLQLLGTSLGSTTDALDENTETSCENSMSANTVKVMKAKFISSKTLITNPKQVTTTRERAPKPSFELHYLEKKELEIYVSLAEKSCSADSDISIYEGIICKDLLQPEAGVRYNHILH